MATETEWLVLGGAIAGLLAVDLLVHRGGRASSRKAAIVWSVVWIVTGLAFGGFVALAKGGRAAGEYYAAWLIEKSLSLDNLFVFLVIFANLGIRREHQHQVLVWGILGALFFRAVFIFAGVAVFERWEFVRWIFAAILLLAALRVLQGKPSEEEESRLVGWLSRLLPVTPRVHGTAFVAREDGKRVVTPLLLALMAIELTDILFAIDSVPAAFAVTQDRFVLYSSNAFAILGLRSLYLVLAHVIGELKYLHFGLAAVLAFAALKVALGERLHLEPMVSIGILVALLLPAVVASLVERRRSRRAAL